MQTIGLIGGMSWESTALYYKLINERVRDRMGKLHSAPLLMYSYDFQEIKEMQYADRWGEAADSLADVARRRWCACDCVVHEYNAQAGTGYHVESIDSIDSHW